MLPIIQDLNVLNKLLFGYIPPPPVIKLLLYVISSHSFQMVGLNNTVGTVALGS